MKILFLYQYEFLEPIGIMSLSSFLKQNGHKCDFLDLSLEWDYLKAIQKISPGIIAYSITTGKHSFYQKLNLELKKKLKFFSVFGGPHTTFFPEFIKEEGVDAFCRGEGEYPLLDLVNALESGQGYTDIANLWVKKDGEIFYNEVRPLIEDLDSLPFVDRELVNKYKHYRKLHRRVILTSRGCPYRCSYCFNHSYNDLYKGKGRIVRKRSVNHVIEELKTVFKECAPKRFHFIDDTFILDENWCMDFCKRYEREIAKPFIAYTRVNLVTDEIIQNLKQAGCITVLYAIESANDYIRNRVLDRDISQEQILDAVNIYKKHKLRTYAQNMLGIPDETLDFAFQTLELNIKCKPDYAWCSIFQPYPRTKLWEYCKLKDYLSDEDYDESYHRKSILNIPHRREIENLHHLFPPTVSLPFLLPLVKILIKLPLKNLYYLIWNLHRAWCYFFKVKWIDLSEIFTLE
jgi:anaerobic magnesium-protoporphyrin IX monomethyl ester cyclase